jgi:hypothetical protein
MMSDTDGLYSHLTKDQAIRVEALSQVQRRMPTPVAPTRQQIVSKWLEEAILVESYIRDGKPSA